MEITFGNIITGLSFVAMFYTLITNNFISKGNADIKSRLKTLEENQVSKTEFAAMQKQVELFWSIVQKSMAELLHSPHTPDMDILLEKLAHDTIKRSEIVLLLSMLDDEIVELNKKHYLQVLQPTDKPRLFGIALLRAGLIARLAVTEEELVKI